VVQEGDPPATLVLKELIFRLRAVVAGTASPEDTRAWLQAPNPEVEGQMVSPDLPWLEWNGRPLYAAPSHLMSMGGYYNTVFQTRRLRGGWSVLTSTLKGGTLKGGTLVSSGRPADRPEMGGTFLSSCGGYSES
jgi:hypothetical protein